MLLTVLDSVWSNLITTCTDIRFKTTYLTDVKWAVIWPPILLPSMLVLLPTFTLGSKYLLLDKNEFLTPPFPFSGHLSHIFL